MERLRELHVNGTAIVDLPSSIEHLTGLSLLNISHCKNLVHLRCAILRLELLRDFIVLGRSRLAKFDDQEILPSRKRSIRLWVEEVQVNRSNQSCLDHQKDLAREIF